MSDSPPNLGSYETEEQLLAELAGVGSEIARYEAALADLYSRRLALFKEAKAEHGTINRVLGHAAGSTENAVIAALRKDAQRADDGT